MRKTVLWMALGGIGMATIMIGPQVAAGVVNGPAVDDECWVTMIGEYPDPAAVAAPSPAAAVEKARSSLESGSLKRALPAQASARGKVAVASAQQKSLARLRPASPQKVASSGRSLTSQESLWVVESNGKVEGSAIVEKLEPGKFAVSEHSFMLASEADCSANQLVE